MSTQEPKYQQVVEWVKQNIASGKLKPGERLPSEMELGEQFGLSRQTIRHATGELVNRGIVTRVKGSGTYVNEGADGAVRGGFGGSAYLGAAGGFGGSAGLGAVGGFGGSARLGATGSGGICGSQGTDGAAYPDSAANGRGGIAAGSGYGGRGGAARGVRHQRVAVVSTFYESYIFPPTLRGIEKILSENGYSMQVAFTDNKTEREAEILRDILEKDNIDGLIVEPAKSALPNPNMGYYWELLARSIPVISFNSYYPALPVPCVRLNDVGVAAKAARLLLDAGHRRISGIFKLDDGQGRDRYGGYCGALQMAGVPLEERRAIWIDTVDYRDLAGMGERLFVRLGDSTGVVCYNDEVAYQLIELALARGLRVPDDLSVVGIDDSYLAGMSKVAFTSFPHPKEILGQKVAENLIQMIANPEFDGNYLFDCEPVERDSVRVVRGETGAQE